MNKETILDDARAWVSYMGWPGPVTPGESAKQSTCYRCASPVTPLSSYVSPIISRMNNKTYKWQRLLCKSCFELAEHERTKREEFETLMKDVWIGDDGVV